MEDLVYTKEFCHFLLILQVMEDEEKLKFNRKETVYCVALNVVIHFKGTQSISVIFFSLAHSGNLLMQTEDLDTLVDSSILQSLGHLIAGHSPTKDTESM